MKKKVLLSGLMATCLMVSAAGCSGVKQEDYDALQAKLETLQKEYDALEEETETKQAEYEELQAKLEQTEKEKAAAEEEKAAIEEEYSAFKEEIEEKEAEEQETETKESETEEERENEDVSEEDPLMVQEEGYVIEGEGYRAEVTWCENNGQKIFGRMYYPEDFDETKQYTTVVMNHGKSINCDFWHKAYAPELARNGYVCYAFDCRSCTEGGRGCFSDLLEEGEETTVSSYSEDLNAVLDFVESKEYVDMNNLYLFGQSMGGMTVQNVAAQRPEEIRGVVVLYGAIGKSAEKLVGDYETLKAEPYNNGEVLFILGALEGDEAIQNTLENMEWYDETSFVLVSGAGHGFGYTMDRPAKICAQNVIDFIARTSAE